MQPRDAYAMTALQTMRPVVFAGVLVIGIFFGGLGGWAAIAPLESAAIAPGVLSVEGSRRTIQHLEGGIVAEILVREGERVRAGQPLIRLDQTQARATLEQLRTRYHSALALEARLIAERDGQDRIDVPDALDASSSAAKVAEAIAGEVSIFDARRRAMAGEAAILEQRVAQYREEIEGLEGQIAAQTRQLALIGSELRSQRKLLERKLTGTQRLIELQRDEAEIAGSRSRNVAAIARVRQNIAEEQLKVTELGTRRVNEVVEELRRTQTALSDLRERMRAAEDVLERTRIHSPLDGVIVDLRVHTVGGVVAAGAALMDIVPVDEALIVQAQVSPEDIDSVHPGLTAQVVITAFNRRSVPPVVGTVKSVSADRLTDPGTGRPYFLARIELPRDPFAGAPGLALYPGMQAEVMIVTGEHTALDYMLRPAMRSFDRALRED